MSNLEIFAFIASIFLILKGWVTWYGDIVSVNRLGNPFRRRLLLFMTPIFCLLVVLATLEKLAATAVRGDLLYIVFFLLVGAGWLGGMTLLFPFLGVSARDDVLERGNRSASWTLSGALIGASCAFAGANIGNGPGVEAVLFSAVLSSALFMLLWFGMEAATSISETVTVDRSLGAGVRLGGFLISEGTLSGWAVSGDWVSTAGTLQDFVRWSWPAILLSVAGVLVEFGWRKKFLKDSSSGASIAFALAYVALAIIWVVSHGVHS